MSNDLNWRLKMANESNEEIEVDLEHDDKDQAIITLSIPGFRCEHTKTSHPAQRVQLTEREFEEVAALMNRFKDMLKVRAGRKVIE